MKCCVCRTTLHKIGISRKEYRDQSGRIYKRINWPRYAPCPNLGDPAKHPARIEALSRGKEVGRG